METPPEGAVPCRLGRNRAVKPILGGAGAATGRDDLLYHRQNHWVNLSRAVQRNPATRSIEIQYQTNRPAWSLTTLNNVLAHSVLAGFKNPNQQGDERQNDYHSRQFRHRFLESQVLCGIYYGAELSQLTSNRLVDRSQPRRLVHYGQAEKFT